MYPYPKHIEIPSEVTAYLKDRDIISMNGGQNGWYGMAEKFQTHLAKMCEVAKQGNPLAQYHVASIYSLGLIHSSEQDHAKHHDADAITMTFWLEKAARQGIIAAVDNLVTSGIGKEADRLRLISQAVEKEHPELIEWTEEYGPRMPVILPAFFEKVWEIAYGNPSAS